MRVQSKATKKKQKKKTNANNKILEREREFKWECTLMNKYDTNMFVCMYSLVYFHTYTDGHFVVRPTNQPTQQLTTHSFIQSVIPSLI